VPTPPAFDAHVRGSHRPNIGMKFSAERLEWFGYPTGKYFEDTFIRFNRIHEHDGRTSHDGIGRAYA